MNLTLIISIAAGIAAFCLFNAVFNISFFGGAKKYIFDTIDTLAEHLGKYNTKRYVERIKRERIIKQKENLYTKYNRLAEGLILDFNLPLTLESFTSILCILFVVTVLIIVVFMQNVTLSVVMTVAIFVGILTYFVMQSKNVKSERLENIMDAEDMICPLARDGVLVAIKKVLDSEETISPNIRPFFQQFVDNCENNGYSFKQAITLLNRQLGPKFDNFTKKAIVFEYNERKGMADVFLDIVDENAVLREINGKKDRIFRKMNREFLIKTCFVIGFFIYALTVEAFRKFMLWNDFGKFINTIVISIICISFAMCQALQGDLISGGHTK